MDGVIRKWQSSLICGQLWITKQTQSLVHFIIKFNLLWQQKPCIFYSKDKAIIKPNKTDLLGDHSNTSRGKSIFCIKDAFWYRKCVLGLM
jgi:hypothetical protein